MRRERHPEKGPTTCNVSGGHVCYSNYDPRGHAGQKVEAGRTLRYTYDRAERLTRVEEAMGFGTWRVLKAFAYGEGKFSPNWSNGKVATAERYNYVTLFGSPYTIQVRESYTYGGRQGRASSRLTESSINGQAPDAFTQSWTYNTLGDLSSLGYPQCTTCALPAARTQSFTYTNGFLTAVPSYATSITYHLNGLVNQIAHTNGMTLTQGNDPNGMRRPASISATYTPTGTLRWNSGTYTYDGAGNVVTIGASSYYYDLVGRLVSSTVNTSATGTTTVTQAYTYDAFGNIQSINGSTGGRTTTTSSATNRLATAGTSYDDAGNMTFWNGQSYEYDRFHQPWRMVTGEEWIHLYTAGDERLWSYQVTGGEKNRWTIRDLDGRVLREYGYNRPTNTWSVTGDYLYRDGLLLAKDTNVAGTVRHFHLDHLGSPRLITNGSGSQVAYHAYYPFGEEATGVTQDTERMKFTGHERDLNSQSGSTPAADDLDYMHARFYNPQLGRFTSTDPKVRRGPVKHPQLWNRYGYAVGNPLRYIDAEGQDIVSAFSRLSQSQSVERIKEFSKNPRVRAVASLGAAKIAEVASEKLPPGKARGTVLLASAALTLDSAAHAAAASGASFALAASTTQTGTGAAVAGAFGIGFGILAIADLSLAAELLERAVENISKGTDPADREIGQLAPGTSIDQPNSPEGGSETSAGEQEPVTCNGKPCPE